MKEEKSAMITKVTFKKTVFKVKYKKKVLFFTING